MAGELLFDTGPLVSLLDRSQTAHRACAKFYGSWDGRLVTSEAVITESVYLLSQVRGGPAACIDFILQSDVLVFPSTEASLKRCRYLLDKYSDMPMDFADATLVVIAEEIGTDLVFTLDRDFHVYRLHGRKQFTILPQLSSAS